jgi:hypothetical protein
MLVVGSCSFVFLWPVICFYCSVGLFFASRNHCRKDLLEVSSWGFMEKLVGADILCFHARRLVREPVSRFSCTTCLCKMIRGDGEELLAGGWYGLSGVQRTSWQRTLLTDPGTSPPSSCPTFSSASVLHLQCPCPFHPKSLKP